MDAAKNTPINNDTYDRILAVDVARFGRDSSVALYRQGGEARIEMKWNGRDTMKLVGWIRNYLDEAIERGEPIDYCVIDANGVGAGVVDRLNEVNMEATVLIPFNAGESAEEAGKFGNAGTEAWWRMRKWFLREAPYELMEPCIPNEPALIGQVTTRQYFYSSDKRIMIESKTKMEKSPDEADALAMTFAPTLNVPNVRWL